MNTRSARAMPPPGPRNGMGPRRQIIRDLLVLVSLIVPAYVVSVALFVIGFLIMPNGGADPSVPLRFGDTPAFIQAASRVQDLVLVALPGSILVGGVARVLGARLPTAIRVVAALTGIYWAALLGTYIAGIVAGAFALPVA